MEVIDHIRTAFPDIHWVLDEMADDKVFSWCIPLRIWWIRDAGAP